MEQDCHCEPTLAEKSCRELAPPTDEQKGVSLQAQPARYRKCGYTLYWFISQGAIGRSKLSQVGKIHSGQSVSAVIVPGLANLTMQSGGFTGSRVAEHLQTHCHAPNKQLVVMDQPILVQDNTSSGEYDSCDCVILKKIRTFVL